MMEGHRCVHIENQLPVNNVARKNIHTIYVFAPHVKQETELDDVFGRISDACFEHA